MPPLPEFQRRHPRLPEQQTCSAIRDVAIRCEGATPAASSAARLAEPSLLRLHAVIPAYRAPVRGSSAPEPSSSQTSGSSDASDDSCSIGTSIASNSTAETTTGDEADDGVTSAPVGFFRGAASAHTAYAPERLDPVAHAQVYGHTCAGPAYTGEVEGPCHDAYGINVEPQAVGYYRPPYAHRLPAYHHPYIQARSAAYRSAPAYPGGRTAALCSQPLASHQLPTHPHHHLHGDPHHRHPHPRPIFRYHSHPGPLPASTAAGYGPQVGVLAAGAPSLNRGERGPTFSGGDASWPAPPLPCPRLAGAASATATAPAGSACCPSGSGRGACAAFGLRRASSAHAAAGAAAGGVRSGAEAPNPRPPQPWWAAPAPGAMRQPGGPLPPPPRVPPPPWCKLESGAGDGPIGVSAANDAWPPGVAPPAPAPLPDHWVLGAEDEGQAGPGAGAQVPGVPGVPWCREDAAPADFSWPAPVAAAPGPVRRAHHPWYGSAPGYGPPPQYYRPYRLSPRHAPPSTWQQYSVQPYPHVCAGAWGMAA